MSSFRLAYPGLPRVGSFQAGVVGGAGVFQAAFQVGAGAVAAGGMTEAGPGPDDWPSRNSLQCLHFFAVARIVSPQNGQSFVSPRGGEDWSGGCDGPAGGRTVATVGILTAATGVGTSITPPHPGHLIFRPAKWLEIPSFFPHPHVCWIGIMLPLFLFPNEHYRAPLARNHRLASSVPAAVKGV